MPAVPHEGQRPLPVIVSEIAVRPGLPNLIEQFFGTKPTAQRHAHQVLYQYVQWSMGRAAGFDAAFGDRDLGGRGFHYFDAVCRDQRDAGSPTRRMPRATGPLHQPSHALGRTDLQNTFDRQEIHAQIQAGGADHGLERALLEAQFDPVAHLACQRAVVQRDQPGPVRPRAEDRLVPDFRLGAGIGKDQRCGSRVDLLDHLRQHAQPEMAGPGEAFNARRQQGIDTQILVDPTLHQLAAPRMQQHLQRMGLVAEGRRQPPHDELRHPLTKPRQRQLQLHATLIAQQLMPLVHHQHAQAREGLARIGAGQQQGQAFRCGHQRGG